MSEVNAVLITVNFRQTECTLEFLKSVSSLRHFDRCRVFIVDNHSGDRSVKRLEQAAAAFANVDLLGCSENRGYFGGAKWALHQYLAKHSLPDWIIVCNNDIAFKDIDFLARLTEHAPQAEGVLAPALISSLTNHDSNPMIAARPGRIRLLRYRLLLSTYPIAWLTQWLAPAIRKLRHRIGGRAKGAERRPIYAPHGAMIIFSRRYFEEGGTIDDGSFLFAEEFSVAETCLRLGLPLVHDPSFRVLHDENRTTGRRLTRQMYQFQKAGLQYAIHTYFQDSHASAKENCAIAADLK